MDDHQQKQWKKEADQLKKDLDSRPKIIKKREVPIRVNDSRHKQTPEIKTPDKHIKNADELLRKQLGL